MNIQMPDPGYLEEIVQCIRDASILIAFVAVVLLGATSETAQLFLVSWLN